MTDLPTIHPPAISHPLWAKPWRDIASEALSAQLVQLGKPRTLGHGEFLYRRGDPGRDLIGISAGMVRIVNFSAEGHEMLAGLYTAGTWFGEVSLFDELPRPFDAYSVGQTELLVVSADQLRTLLDANPHWYRDFAKVVCYKLRHAVQFIEDQFLPISARIAKRLIDLSMAYGVPGPLGVRIDLRLSQEDLGRMLGITRQTVNKELRAFEEKGWIALKAGQITLTNPHTLREWVQTITTPAC